jgi:riboflavin kinase/FMN adenylyltransferase
MYRGIVKKGSKRAAGLGYPTINIPLEDKNVSGIFAAKVSAGGAEYIAAAFADPSRGILEAHLIDFDRDLYGEEVTIELVEKLRESKRYDNDVALKTAISEDIAKVTEYFKN